MSESHKIYNLGFEDLYDTISMYMKDSNPDAHLMYKDLSLSRRELARVAMYTLAKALKENEITAQEAQDIIEEYNKRQNVAGSSNKGKVSIGYTEQDLKTLQEISQWSDLFNFNLQWGDKPRAITINGIALIYTANLVNSLGKVV